MSIFKIKEWEHAIDSVCKVTFIRFTNCCIAEKYYYISLLNTIFTVPSSIAIFSSEFYFKRSPLIRRYPSRGMEYHLEDILRHGADFYGRVLVQNFSPAFPPLDDITLQQIDHRLRLTTSLAETYQFQVLLALERNAVVIMSFDYPPVILLQNPSLKS